MSAMTTPPQEQERAAVVAWLRRRAEPFECRADKEIADAIERGEHLNPLPSKDQ